MQIELSSLDLLLMLAVAIISVLITYIIAKANYKSIQDQYDLLKESKSQLETELLQERELLSDSNDRVSGLKNELVRVQADFGNLRNLYDTEISDSKKREERFEHLANRVLETQRNSFDQQQKKGITQLLEPLQAQIKQFEHKVERSNTAAVERHTSLKEQINFLREGNAQISQEANNLTKALKGDSKIQGNWGELILESVLDRSGLEKGREYFIQVSERDAEGQVYRPDVVIALPDGKRLIIDSKVSLRAYEAAVSAEDEDIQRQYARAHLKAVRDHVDKLSVKNYHDLYQIESPDFVMMFVPIDTAFSMALRSDEGLYQYAFDKNIVIVTPSTLLATLKTVETIWRNDKQNRYALEIASEAGKMYDKFSAFVDDMATIGRQLNTVQNTYQKSYAKLHTGQGNLVRRAEKMKALGAKASKQITVASIPSETLFVDRDTEE